MIDGISLLNLTPIGVICLVLAFPYLQLARGKLVPRSAVEDLIHDRDEWRAAHRISEQARQTSADQVEELLEHARTTEAIIRALPKARQGST